MDEFRFSTELKVRFSETDAQGVAHHAAYLDWLEVARVEYLARFRFDYAIERAGEPIADGWTSHACVDARTLRPTRMPEWLKAELERAERAESSAAESTSG